MATTNKDVIGIAKGTTRKKTTRKPAAKKTTRKPAAKKKATTKKPVEKPLTADELRDQKAKAKVEELLEDVQLTPDKKEEELLVLDETPEEPKGVEWLEEQISLLAQDNERLKAENDVLLGENQQFRAGANPVNDGIKTNVVSLFDELQQNHLRMGIPAGSKVGNFRIYCPGFLDRMITFFPFLSEYKQY
jgi:hypothetical protein